MLSKKVIFSLVHELSIELDVPISAYLTGHIARAIREKMREDVVAKIHGRWTTDDLGYHVLTVDSHSNWEDQKIRMATVMQGQLEDYYGQRVTITVTKEEGDGPGNH